MNVIANSFNRMVSAVEKDVLSTNVSMQITGRLGQAQTIGELAENVCTDLLIATEAMISAFYMQHVSDGTLHPIASVGIPLESLPVFDALRPSGTLSHAALTNDVHFLRGLDSPNLSFVTIAGIAQPAEIATLMIRDEGLLSGAVMLARATPFTETDESTLIKIMPELRLALKRMLQRVERERLSQNIQEKNELLETLTRELQQKSVELQRQSEALQQQSEELQQQSEELQVQNLTLEQQQQDLMQANKEKSTFLSNMSHELRTPLNVILSLSRALQLQMSTRTTLEEKEYIEIIKHNGQQLLENINDLLELSRLESGVLKKEIEQIDIKASVGNLIDKLRPLAIEKGLAMTLSAAEDLPALHADRRSFELVLQNLISNAIKFTKTGKVEVEIHAEPQRLRFVVRDTGIGIPKEHFAVIFKEFHQVDSSARRNYGGVGLGLAIANTAVKKLGGRIEVQSTPGAGSAFTVILPIGVPSGDAEHETSHTHKRTSRVIRASDHPEKREHLCIIDDNEAVLDQLQEVLQQDGYRLSLIVSGAIAIDRLITLKPDGVLLDLMIPEKNGFEILKEMRRHPLLSEMPVLVITAKTLSDAESRVLAEASVLQVLTKGLFDEEDLLQAIYSMLKPSMRVPGAFTSGAPR
jgi:signal transduction histidine kinase